MLIQLFWSADLFGHVDKAQFLPVDQLRTRYATFSTEQRPAIPRTHCSARPVSISCFRTLPSDRWAERGYSVNNSNEISTVTCLDRLSGILLDQRMTGRKTSFAPQCLNFLARRLFASRSGRDYLTSSMVSRRME
ncbi:hypothetical protein RvY_06619 [Ramazzottius varieornatus]|uniref:Uncharacterized protein n=1 Tax=Ramazzottius varieornatus TaxID=947166 RepID=A0A1D1V247_RAMVA|nr:hypothetical protein RvY_06619 [Ramazzottius varieornatus]